MSKTSDANSAKEMVATYWKQFVALGTDWLNKYRDDAFVRGTMRVIALQFGFIIVVQMAFLGVVYFTIQHVSDAITATVYAYFGANIPSDLLPSILSNAQDARGGFFLAFLLVLVPITIGFSYFVAHITLKPAREALTFQKQFIGNIAHELRTPLSVIKTNSEISLLDSHISNDQKEFVTSNIEELDRISQIINNLLSLSTLIRPEKMEFHAVDLTALSKAVVSNYAALAHRNNVRITVHKGTDGYVWGNVTALEQIVSNLIKNAIIYTPHGGSITLSTFATSTNRIEFIVQDTGVGIARKDLQRIFEPFYRADPSRTRGSAGSGLGLTIISELVRLHHGRINVKSEVGRGTSVSVILPSAQRNTEIPQNYPSRDVNEIQVDYSKGMS